MGIICLHKTSAVANSETPNALRVLEVSECLLHLFSVSWCLLGPLIEMGIDVSVIATKSRVEDLVRVAERIHQRHRLSPHHTQEAVQLFLSQRDLPRGHVAVLYVGR